jgi:hypothetical protein
MAQVAAPSVENVAAAPDQDAEPEMCSASSAPIERVEPKPKPEST